MKNRIKTRWLLISGIFLLAVLAGITYAWFIQNAALTTLLSIEKPDTITISNVDGSEMTELDLDYREGTDQKDADGKIHIFRPVCIKSTADSHQLEIVHTTNLESLEFKVYPVAEGAGFDKDDPGILLSGSYVNPADESVYKTAKQEKLQNYSDSDTVDAYAYPLYWIAQICSTQPKEEDGWRQVSSTEQTEFDVASKSEKIFYYTYYYLEISWQETTKETDLFYVMARNISE